MTANKQYKILKSTAEFYKDERFCTVIATSLALGLTYEEGWSLMNKYGRTSNKGMNGMSMLAAIQSLGVVLECVDPKSKTISKFNLKGNFLLFTSGHVLSHQYGETLDHTDGGKHRIHDAWKVVEIPHDIKSKIDVKRVTTNYKEDIYALVDMNEDNVYKWYKRKPSRPSSSTCISSNRSAKLKYVNIPRSKLEDEVSFWKMVRSGDYDFITNKEL